MKSLKKLLAYSALLASTAFATAQAAQPDLLMADAGGKLSFVNHAGATIKVVVNGDPNVGMPIGPDGQVLDYWLVRVICSANVTSCNTQFLVDDIEVGYAYLNAKTGELLNYTAHSPYGVNLDPNEVPLRTVEFTHA